MKRASTTPTALVLIDIQKAFAPITQDNPHFEPNITSLLNSARAHNERTPENPILIIHVHHHSLEPQSTLNPSHILPSGERGIDPMPYASPLPGEPILTKHRNSAFVGTDLEARLRAFGARQLVLAGLTTDHCVCTTARFAANLQVLGDEGGPDGTGDGNNGIVLLRDGTATFGKGRFDAEMLHEVHLAGLDGEFVQVRKTEEAIAAIMA